MVSSDLSLKFVQCVVQTCGAFSLGLLFNGEEVLSSTESFYVFNSLLLTLSLVSVFVTSRLVAVVKEEETEEEDGENNTCITVHPLFCLCSGVLSITVVNALIFVHQGGPYTLIILLFYVALPYNVCYWWSCLFHASSPNDYIKTVCVFMWFFGGLLLSPYVSYIGVGIAFIISSFATLCGFKRAEEALFYPPSLGQAPLKGFQSLEFLFAIGVFYGATHISHLESTILGVGIVCVVSPLSVILYLALEKPRWLKSVGFLLCALGLNTVPEVSLLGVCVFGPLLWHAMIEQPTQDSAKKACLVLGVFAGARLLPDHSVLGYPWWVDNVIVGGVVFVSLVYEVALWWVWRRVSDAQCIVYTDSKCMEEEHTYTIENEPGYVFSMCEEEDNAVELQEI